MHFTKAENGLARNSESEVNSDSEREFGQAGAGLITSISAPTFPAFKPLPKVHDYTLLFNGNGRAPYILGCVAEIVTANGWKTFIPVAAHARGRHLGSGTRSCGAASLFFSCLRRMKSWEIIADNLSEAGWSYGYVSAVDLEGRTIWIADAHHGDGCCSIAS